MVHQQDVWRIGPFSLEERCAAESHVYRAIHLEQRRPYAVKLIHAPFLAQSPARAEFSRELHNLKRLVHPHIVRCYGGGVDKGYGFLASDWIEGENLSQLIARRGRLSWEQAVEHALQLCDGLEYALGEGFVHHDLTPDKMLIDSQGVLKIADFRCDRASNPWCESSSLRELPRVAYTSPEIIDHPSDASDRADLYSLGCIFFEMLVGHPPFPHGSAVEVMEHHRSSAPPKVSAAAMETPVWLDHLTQQLLQKAPQQRPYGVPAVRLALLETTRKVGAGQSVTAHALAGFSPLQVPVNRQEAQKVVGKARRSSGKRFYERTWFWALCVLLAAPLPIGLAVWGLPKLFKPPSDEVMIERAEALIATQRRSKEEEARRRYLRPLIERSEPSPFADRAQELIDRIDMNQAHRRMQINLRLKRSAKSEAERVYSLAWQEEQAGDREQALEGYQNVVTTFEKNEEDRPYVMLARQRMKELSRLIAEDPDESPPRVEEQLEPASNADAR